MRSHPACLPVAAWAFDVVFLMELDMSPIYPTEFYREDARKWARFEEATRQRATASFARELPPQPGKTERPVRPVSSHRSFVPGALIIEAIA
jgi:hypothetical protein